MGAALFFSCSTYNEIPNISEVNVPTNPIQKVSVSARSYTFDGSMSRNVLESYLSRACNYNEILHPGDGSSSGGGLTEGIRMLKNIGAKFIGRVAYIWGPPCGQVEFFANYVKPNAATLLAADPQFILQACIFEIVRDHVVPYNVDEIPIPASVFTAFGQTVVTRNFNYDLMIFTAGTYVNQWGTGMSVPDMTRLETRMYFYWLATNYIDAGCESIHWGQTNLICKNDANYTNTWDLFTKIRAYAKTKARRHFVLMDAHTKGVKDASGKLLFDFHAFPQRPIEICATPYNCTLGKNIDNLIGGGSLGGTTISGWTCTNLPYLMEFDNSGNDTNHTCSNPTAIWPWGWDEISWFAHCSEAYRNSYLEMAVSYLGTNEPGFIEMPGRVWLADRSGLPAPTRYWYYLNNANAANFNEGFNQETKVKDIWAAGSIVQDYTLAGHSAVVNFTPLNDDRWVGNLTISGTDVTDADMATLIPKIKRIKGTFTLNNTACTNLGNFFVSIPLEGGMVVTNNANLNNINSIGIKIIGTLNGDLTLNNNPLLDFSWDTALPNGSGFQNVTRITGNLTITNCPMFVDVAFKSLARVDGNVTIQKQTEISTKKLWNFNKIPLTYIGGNLIIQNNPSLTSLIGLERLTTIAGSVITIVDNGTGITDYQNGLGEHGFCIIKDLKNAGRITNAGCVITLRRSGQANIDFATLGACY